MVNAIINEIRKIQYKYILIWLIIFTLILLIVANFIWAFRNNNLRDFGSFIASGLLANQGKNPYSIDHPLIFTVYFPELNLEVISPNLNPPLSISLFQIISLFDAQLMLKLWQIISIFCYICLVYLSIKFSPQKSSTSLILWAFAFGGMWHTIELGQIYLPLALIAGLIGIKHLYNKNNLLTGILSGILIALKPNFLLVLPFYLIKKKWRLAFFSISSALILSIVPIILDGFDIYLQWFHTVSLYNGYRIPGNNSFLGLLQRFNVAYLVYPFQVALVTFCLIWIWKKNRSLSTAYTTALVLSLLTSPIAWPGYSTFLTPYFFSKRLTIPLKVSAIIFTIPVMVIFHYYQNSLINLVSLGWLYGWGFVFFLTDTLFAKETDNNTDEEFR